MRGSRRLSALPQNMKLPQQPLTQTTPPPLKTPGSCWRGGRLVPRSLFWRIRKRSSYGGSACLSHYVALYSLLSSPFTCFSTLFHLVAQESQSQEMHKRNFLGPCSDSDSAYSHDFSLPLHSGATDTFEFSSKHVGEIAGICIGHITKDGKKVKNEAFWHVMEVVVTEMELGNK